MLKMSYVMVPIEKKLRPHDFSRNQHQRASIKWKEYFKQDWTAKTFSLQTLTLNCIKILVFNISTAQMKNFGHHFWELLYFDSGPGHVYGPGWTPNSKSVLPKKSLVTLIRPKYVLKPHDENKIRAFFFFFWNRWGRG